MISTYWRSSRSRGRYYQNQLLLQVALWDAVPKPPPDPAFNRRIFTVSASNRGKWDPRLAEEETSVFIS